ncbi:RagB/SusD family nutrient uptake outer membrane protein [Spirosoma aureum]|uniref:RagB/SusD family nutrient uptake outer membrane protein n=1 Tax=Spirosoma aureum TaxID=2692134 RepID=A0A6G9ALZ0_9BACT|nr:RagB/SusD family nutrient uptake outer membrane protein [Spirosoma aureum]QIP13491.1 RagB/SusD family nutrient uptake outer membrane protein [Spirosoma aureum]
MKLYTFKQVLATAIMTCGLAACSSLIEVKPRTSIDSGTALTSQEAINAAVNAVYDALQSTDLYGRDLIALPEALSDNGRATNNSSRLVPEYQNQSGAHMINWTQDYYGINQANLVLDALTKVKLTDALRNSYEGQCLFLRALMYFDLVKAYAYMPTATISDYNRGGVPLILSGVLTLPQVTYPERATTDAVYTQILADLTAAIEKLSATAKTRGPIYATQGAAQALYSRVALYAGKYQEAADFATKALASGIGTFQPKANYIAGWRTAINPESMFEINFQTSENIGVNTSLQTTFTTLTAVGNRTTTGGFGDLVPTVALLADLESEKDASGAVLDIRRQLYELGTSGRGAVNTETTKFLGKNGTINLDNVPVIRISEMYLNRAEAYYRLGKEADAIKDLNTIRTRSGLAEKTTLTGAALLDEIIKQRRLEFAFEGHRFWDLKRLGRDIVKLPTTVPFTDYRILARIPIAEINNNPKLKQNYNY